VAQRDRTTLGGGNESFKATRWTDILRARTLDATRRREAVGGVANQYWKPVYAYLRRRGFNNEVAKDLTQGFFQEVVLGRDLIQKADPQKGRFRTFLLTALDHYVSSVHRGEVAQKARPKEGLLRLEATGFPDVPDPRHGADPEQAFTYAWASQLLDEVIATVESACRESGQGKHWEVFRRTVLQPILAGAEVPPLSVLCTELGLESERQASNMKITVKRRFRTYLRSRVRELVDSDEEVEQEIRDLMAILSRGGTRS